MSIEIYREILIIDYSVRNYCSIIEYLLSLVNQIYEFLYVSSAKNKKLRCKRIWNDSRESFR